MQSRHLVALLVATPLSAQAAITLQPTRNAPVAATPEAAAFENLRVLGSKRTGPMVIHLDPRRLSETQPRVPSEPEGFIDLADVVYLDAASTPPFPSFPSSGVVRPTLAQVQACMTNPAPCGPPRAPGAYLLITLGVPRIAGDSGKVTALTYHHELANPNDHATPWGTATIWWEFRLRRSPAGWAVVQTTQRGGLNGLIYMHMIRR